MPTNKGIISSPISVEDVKKALGVSSNDVGILCSSDRIKQFAKYRPMEVSGKFELTENDRYNNNYGWMIPSPTDYQHIISKDYVEYGYNLPSTIYRLTDFENYNHNSEPLIIQPDVITLYDWIYLGGFLSTISIRYKNITTLYNIKYEDMKDLGEWYQCILVFKDNVFKVAMSAGTKVKDGIVDISSWNLNEIDFKDVKVYHAFIDKPINITGGLTNINELKNYKFIPLYGKSYSTTEIIPDKYPKVVYDISKSFSPSGTIENDYYKITYSGVQKGTINQFSSTYYCGGNYWHIRLDSIYGTIVNSPLSKYFDIDFIFSVDGSSAVNRQKYPLVVINPALSYEGNKYQFFLEKIDTNLWLGVKRNTDWQSDLNTFYTLGPGIPPNSKKKYKCVISVRDQNSEEGKGTLSFVISDYETNEAIVAMQLLNQSGCTLDEIEFGSFRQYDLDSDSYKYTIETLDMGFDKLKVTIFDIIKPQSV